MSDGSLARRYARALVALGADSALTDRLGQQLDAFTGVVQQDDGLLGSVLGNPGLTTLERRAVLDKVLERMALHAFVANFLRLLVDKNRFEHLPAINIAYREMADEQARRVRATVTTARKLDPAISARVRQTLEGSTGKTVVLTEVVDAKVLGGMVVQLGDTVYDASIRARLASVQDALMRPAGQA